MIKHAKRAQGFRFSLLNGRSKVESFARLFVVLSNEALACGALARRGTQRVGPRGNQDSLFIYCGVGGARVDTSTRRRRHIIYIGDGRLRHVWRGGR
ncbi:hypothetical protein GCWU000325_02623 [Alloprevotella tannerae ATCC 51259]|uniref:Uncharacterized protein n=1 Tax=Alloprevotella tannerae ATCC 51259 TaxID=626522 RepID=C9LK58_9BACT|nr:hypothetical protein GCWU000325_02623 [Alloprevotella tannerae ATCC 51259]